MQYLTNCVNSDGDAINAMIDAARQISRRTFLRYVDRDSLRDIERQLGYSARGLRMANDWHVTYHRSTFNGRPCCYFVHSAIEYLVV
jgi:hypothetical protein